MKNLKQIYPPLLVKRKAPVNLEPGDEKYFGYPPNTYSAPAIHLVQIKNAVVSFEGVLIKNLKVLKNFIVGYHNDFVKYAGRYPIYNFLKNKTQKVDQGKSYLIVFDNYSGPKGFFHWISDGLARMVEINDMLKEHVLLCPDYFKNEKLYTDTIYLFDVGEIVFIRPHSYVRVKNLLVPEHIGSSGNYIPANVHKLREFIWNKFNLLPETDPYDKVYISRSQATRRFVTNEEEVENLLTKYGFRVMHFEALSFKQQVEQIFKTKYLVSIHGAALAHIHFMRPGTHVMEFRRENDGENCVYYHLAGAAEVNYYYQFCPADVKSAAANNFNLTVNVTELEKNIKLMLSKHA